jgi:8-oxo-dGTP diphosphatase
VASSPSSSAARSPGGSLTTTDETANYRWASQQEIPDLADEAYAIRLTDALSRRTTPAIRQHDGHHLL